MAIWAFRIGLTILGYGVAVCVAAGVTIAFWLLPTALPDAGLFGSPTSPTDDLAGTYLFGVFVTGITALPGFLAILALAIIRRWRTWSCFAVAGAFNALPSILIFAAWMDSPPTLLGPGLTLACLPGGFAGGLAFWALAGRHAGALRRVSA